MLELIAVKHDLNPSFWDVVACFYSRNRELEETFCLPYTQHRDGTSVGRYACLLPVAKGLLTSGRDLVHFEVPGAQEEGEKMGASAKWNLPSIRHEQPAEPVCVVQSQCKLQGPSSCGIPIARKFG